MKKKRELLECMNESPRRKGSFFPLLETLVHSFRRCNRTKPKKNHIVIRDCWQIIKEGGQEYILARIPPTCESEYLMKDDLNGGSIV